MDGVYPEAAEIEPISKIGTYLFLTDDSMDMISQFSSLNFVIHFAHYSMRYPSVLNESLFHS